MEDIFVIEDGVLEECTDNGATSVEIPSSVTEIGGGRSMVASRLRQLRFRRA